MARAWLFTVSSPMMSRAAMARLDSPATISPRTSLSRCERPSRAPGQNSPLSSRAAAVAARAARTRPAGRPGGADVPPEPHLLERPDEFLAAHPLEQVPGGPGAQRLVEVL